MKIFSYKKKLIKFIQSEHSLGFVPTMGTLHPGHISLIKKSLYQCNKTIVSIFVNKPQFNNKNDYKKYPRNLKKDIKILKKLKVDYLYIPSHKEIYERKKNQGLLISAFSKKLCGKYRPGHFTAVVDVIDRFIKIINPKKIYLGNKDMQQLKILEDFLNKNYKMIKIVGCKTVREKNGIAYSSRNLSLSKNEKRIASHVYKLILKRKKSIIKNKNLISLLKKNVLQLGLKNLEYLKLIDINKIIKPHKKTKNYRIFIAYYLGKTRLIDNI